MNTPDLSLLPPEQRNDPGYVVDFLVRFNIVQKERKTVLLNVISTYKPTKIPSLSKNHIDALDNEWHASGDLM